MKNTVTRVKTFVRKHKFAVGLVSGIAITAALDTMLYSASRKELNDFLEEKGLTDEYYSPED